MGAVSSRALDPEGVMPPSRIAFAFGDLTNEIRSLLPKDAKAAISLTLDDATYALVGRELADHSGVPRFNPLSSSFTFAGIKVVREMPDV